MLDNSTDARITSVNLYAEARPRTNGDASCRRFHGLRQELGSRHILPHAIQEAIRKDCAVLGGNHTILLPLLTAFPLYVTGLFRIHVIFVRLSSFFPSKCLSGALLAVLQQYIDSTVCTICVEMHVTLTIVLTAFSQYGMHIHIHNRYFILHKTQSCS